MHKKRHEKMKSLINQANDAEKKNANKSHFLSSLFKLNKKMEIKKKTLVYIVNSSNIQKK